MLPNVLAGPAEPKLAPASAEGLFDTNILGRAAVPRAERLLTGPIILVLPASIDFGLVATNKTATNTFLVENAGGGRLVGKASVSPPFEIIEGGIYSLRRNEAQVVTIAYSPRRYTGSNDVQIVSFIGGGGTKAKVTGTPSRGKPVTRFLAR